MKLGYARTSTAEQQAGFEAQIRELEAQGCKRIYREQVSSIADRPQLEAALDYVEGGPNSGHSTAANCRLRASMVPEAQRF